MSTRVVKEGSTSYHTLDIEGKDGEPVTPEALRYRLQDGRKNVLVDWTVLPTATIDFEIDAAHNIIGAGGQERIITVEVTHNGGRKITSAIGYGIEDLQGIAQE